MVDGVPRRLQDLWNGHDPNAFPPARFASTTRETRPRRLDDGQSGSGCQGVDQSHMTKTVPAADGRSNHVPAVRVWSLNQPAY